MSIEKQKPNKLPARELESHLNRDLSGGIDMEFFVDNKEAFETAKALLRAKNAKLIINTDSENSTRALVKNGKGETIFMTDSHFDIEELADIAYNTSR